MRKVVHRGYDSSQDIDQGSRVLAILDAALAQKDSQPVSDAEKIERALSTPADTELLRAADQVIAE